MQDMVDGGRVPDAPHSRRPGLEPGPITTAANGLKATAGPLNDHRRSVWVPAQGRNDGCSTKIRLLREYSEDSRLRMVPAVATAYLSYTFIVDRQLGPTNAQS
jgi:hypothetical protein